MRKVNFDRARRFAASAEIFEPAAADVYKKHKDTKKEYGS